MFKAVPHLKNFNPAGGQAQTLRRVSAPAPFCPLLLFCLLGLACLFCFFAWAGQAAAATRETRANRPPEAQNMQLARQRLESYSRSVEVNVRFQGHSLYLVGQDGSASPLPDLQVRHVRAGSEAGDGSAEHPFAHPEEAFNSVPGNNLIYIWPGRYESDGAFQNASFSPLRLYHPTIVAGAGQPLVLLQAPAKDGAAVTGEAGLVIPAQAEGAVIWAVRNYGRPPDSPFWPTSGNNFGQHPENEGYRQANLLIWPAPGVPLTLSGLELSCSDGTANAIHMEAELSQEPGLTPKVVKPSGPLTLHNTRLSGFRVALGSWDAVCLVAGNVINNSADFAMLGEGWLGGRSVLLLGRGNEISRNLGACAVQTGQAEAGEANTFSGNQGTVFHARRLNAVNGNLFTENHSAAQVLELSLGRGNKISRHRFDGVRVRYSAEIGRENFIFENGGDGIFLPGRGSNESLRLGEGNHVFGNRRAGLRVGAADLIMGNGNHIYANFEQGISLMPLGSSQTENREYRVEMGKNNRITGNGKEGVLCRGKLVSEGGNIIKGNGQRQFQDLAAPNQAWFSLPDDKIGLRGSMLHLKNQAQGEQP